MVDPNPTESLKFLNWLAPHGPWSLWELDSSVDSSSTSEKIITPTKGNLPEWIHRHHEMRRNLYFLANHKTEKGRKKENITLARVLYVDIDVRHDEGFAEGLKRIGRLMLTQSVLPRPSALIDSGGGFQAFWVLKQPIDLTGEERTQRLADYEARNKAIESVLDGDHCHSVEHIFRLPGTVNFGKPKKFQRHKDREIRLASIIWMDDTTHDLSSFPLPAGQSPGSIAGSNPSHPQSLSKVVLSLSETVTFLADLPPALNQSTRLLIITGRDADSKFGNDRSKYLWRAANDMVRANLSDDEMMSILMDPKWGISQSVIERPDARKYAEKQIMDARAASLHPMLGEMNRIYLSIENYNGRYRIAKLNPETGLLIDSPMAKSDFLDGKNHQSVEVDGDSIPLGTFWFHHPAKNHVQRLSFYPGENESRPGEYNLWRSYGVRASPGDKDAKWLDHLFNIVCDKSQRSFDYMLNWMANAVQRPHLPGQVAIILQGKPGTGKGTVISALVRLFAPWSKQITKSDRVLQRFNAATDQCIFLFLDEAVWSGDKRSHSALKGLITEKLNEVERKFGESTTQPNYLHIMMASNDSHVVHMDEDDRRFFVMIVSDAILLLPKSQQIAYFQAIHRDMEDGGYENLLHRLLTRDISQFVVWDYERGSASKNQAFQSGDIKVKWIYQKLEDQCFFGTKSWTDPIAAPQLRYDFLEFAKVRSMDRRDTTRLGIFLNEMFPGLMKSTKVLTYITENGNTMSGPTKAYVFPPLEECRRRFEMHYGDHDWSEILEVVYDSQSTTDPGGVFE